MEIADHSLDAVMCASAVFLVPDMLAALREWNSVLKPGGRVGFTGFGATFRQPLWGLLEARFRQYGVPVPASQPGHRLVDPGTCPQLVDEAGFMQCEVRSEQLGYHLATAGEWWEEICAMGCSEAVLPVAADQRERFRAEHLAEVQALATDRGIWIDVPVNFAFGLKRAE